MGKLILMGEFAKNLNCYVMRPFQFLIFFIVPTVLTFLGCQRPPMRIEHVCFGFADCVNKEIEMRRRLRQVLTTRVQIVLFLFVQSVPITFAPS